MSRNCIRLLGLKGAFNVKNTPELPINHNEWKGITFLLNNS
jgi:hypothetical protein